MDWSKLKEKKKAKEMYNNCKGKKAKMLFENA